MFALTGGIGIGIGIGWRTIGVDMIFASFIRCAMDVHHVRFSLGEAANRIKIIAKIENQQVVVIIFCLCSFSFSRYGPPKPKRNKTAKPTQHNQRNKNGLAYV
jgi:hypothetical protein